MASASLERGSTRESVGCNTEYTESCQLGRKRGVRHKALDTSDLCAHLLLEHSGAASTEAQTECSEAFAAGTAQTEWPEAIAECPASATATHCPDEADAVQTEADIVCAVVLQSNLQPAHATATAAAAAAATAQRTEAGGDWDEAELENECAAHSAAGEQQIAGDERDAEPHPGLRNGSQAEWLPSPLITKEPISQSTNHLEMARRSQFQQTRRSNATARASGQQSCQRRISSKKAPL